MTVSRSINFHDVWVLVLSNIFVGCNRCDWSLLRWLIVTPLARTVASLSFLSKKFNALLSSWTAWTKALSFGVEAAELFSAFSHRLWPPSVWPSRGWTTLSLLLFCCRRESPWRPIIIAAVCSRSEVWGEARQTRLDVQIFFWLVVCFLCVVVCLCSLLWQENCLWVGACRNSFFGVFGIFLAKKSFQSSKFSEGIFFTWPLFSHFVIHLE